MDITAAVIRAKAAPFSIETLTIDEPRPEEILVRITGAGLCHTDLTIVNHPIVLPTVLGHEGAGVVVAVGERVTKVKKDDHVVLTFVSCGRCANCQKGQPAYCNDAFGPTFAGTRPDGSTTLQNAEERIHGNFFGQSSFATYALATENNVVKVRPDAPIEILGPLGCGIQTGAGAVFNSLRAEVGSTIAIFGLGSVGLSAVMAAAVSGCKTIVGIDLNRERLQLASSLGATHVIDAAEGNPAAAIHKITGGGADFSLENTAQPAVLRQALESTHRRGVCGLIGGAPLGTEVTLDMNTILFGRTLTGIIEGDSIPDLFIPRLVDLYMQGRFPFDRLITFYDLKQINQAVADTAQGRAIKAVLKMSDD